MRPISRLDQEPYAALKHMPPDCALRDLLQAHCALPSLTELSVRYCPKLNARSAFELYQLLQYVSATSVGLAKNDAGDKNSRFATRNLKILNGIDLATLNANAEQGKPLPPCVVRVEW